MITSHRHKFIFIKTRKTAGSTLESILFPYLGEDDICTGSAFDGTPSLNLQLGTSGHKVPEILDNYFVFSIERNPWDKVVSSYYWTKHTKPNFSNVSFEEYILNSKDKLPRDWNKYQNCNKVYRYEEMLYMYKDLSERFGLDIDLEIIKTTKKKSGIRKIKNYKEVHTTKTKKAVEELFSKEIALFGYKY